MLSGLIGAAQLNVARGLSDLELAELGYVFRPDGPPRSVTLPREPSVRMQRYWPNLLLASRRSPATSGGLRSVLPPRVVPVSQGSPPILPPPSTVPA